MAGQTGTRFARDQRRLMSDINVVPFIDVMLVLLVIFMVTAPLLKQGVDVDAANDLMAAIEDIHNVYWATKGRDVAYYVAA